MSCCSSFCRSLLGVTCESSHSPTGALESPLHPAAPEGPGECLPPHREVVTRGGGVQVRPPAGRGAVGIGYDGRVAVRVRAGDHSQQLAFAGPLPTSDAGPDRTSEGVMPSGLARLIGSRATESQHYRLTPARFRTGRARPTLGPMARRGPARRPVHGHNTRRVEMVPALPAGLVVARGDPRVATARGPDGLVLDIPVDHPLWCPGRPHPAAAGLGDPVGQLVRPGRQHPRPAALPRGAAGARGAAALRGLARRPAAGWRSRPG